MDRIIRDQESLTLAGNLQELLAKSDTIVGILKAQKEVLDQRYKTSEASLSQVIERRKTTMSNLEAVQKRIEELNPMLLDIENKIAAARRFFNNAVQEYNTGIQQFPAVLLAGSLGFTPKEFFDVGVEDRKVLDKAPQVKF